MDRAAERGTRRQHLDGGACAPVSVFCSSGLTPLSAGFFGLWAFPGSGDSGKNILTGLQELHQWLICT